MGVNYELNNKDAYLFPYFYGASNVHSFGFVKMSNLTTSFANFMAFLASSTTAAGYQYVKRSSDNKTVYWYNDYVSSATDVFNESGRTYYFMGVC